VENKKPSKKDVINLLKDAWKERLTEEEVRSHQTIWHSSLQILSILGGWEGRC
jgi:hypothetical protein